MNCVAHQSSGLWRHPRDRSRHYNDLSYWTDLAQLLERGASTASSSPTSSAPTTCTADERGRAPHRFAGAGERPDPARLRDGRRHGAPGLRHHRGHRLRAPVPVRPAHLDARPPDEGPHRLERRHRVPAERRAQHGQTDQLSHDDRYDVADEARGDDAVVEDRETGVFTDPSKVHPIEHHGTHFDVPGIHLTEPSVHGSPVVYQAGASPRGIRFAAENAEAVFVGAPTVPQLAATVGRIRDALEAAGRDRYAARVYTLLTVITDETDEAAQAKYRDYRSYASAEARSCSTPAGWASTCRSTTWTSRSATSSRTRSSRRRRTCPRRREDGSNWTVRDIAEHTAIGGLGPVAVGSGDDRPAADRHPGADRRGRVQPGVCGDPRTWEDVIEFVVPELRARGAYPDESTAEPGTGSARGRPSDRSRGGLRPDRWSGRATYSGRVIGSSFVVRTADDEATRPRASRSGSPPSRTGRGRPADDAVRARAREKFAAERVALVVADDGGAPLGSPSSPHPAPAARRATARTSASSRSRRRHRARTRPSTAHRRGGRRRSRRHDRCELHALDDNAPALALYTSAGFRPVGDPFPHALNGRPTRVWQAASVR
ncbi:hypothetical protein Pfo_031641 [Paulownia fortunei]|nr:hypothetical protein Pfo_031641 [Paulownia fortunei]